ncbi:MAG: hypothetical protein BGO41_00265 [Clostridiales bacterium 38-18]|nr:MAG: hypothetical protein BGO41_00265 [Clostridiales bacterium 38-18]
MVETKYSMVINASKEKVWGVLWNDQTFRDWANLIDEGTFMKGELKEGCEVEYISSINGYGVTSYVEKLILNEYVKLKHLADTKENGTENREKEWTGGTESYQLTESASSAGDVLTELSIVMDVPENLVDYFNEVYPKVMHRIKDLSESM